jgi:hypothetical protein
MPTSEPLRFRANLDRVVINSGVVSLTFVTSMTFDVAKIAVEGKGTYSVMVLPDGQPEPAVEAAEPEPTAV